jgi:hypothetical protein
LALISLTSGLVSFLQTFEASASCVLLIT